MGITREVHRYPGRAALPASRAALPPGDQMEHRGRERTARCHGAIEESEVLGPLDAHPADSEPGPCADIVIRAPWPDPAGGLGAAHRNQQRHLALRGLAQTIMPVSHGCRQADRLVDRKAPHDFGLVDAAPLCRDAHGGHRPGERAARLPAPARPPAWSGVSRTHARPAYLAGPYRLCAVRPLGLLAWRSHWSSRLPDVCSHLSLSRLNHWLP